MRKLLIIYIASFAIASFADNSQKESIRITPTVKAVSKVLPTVVNLSTERIVTRSYSPWGNIDPFEHYFDFFSRRSHTRREKTYSLGSGSIIDKFGLIVTNSHVVHRATRIQVILHDGRKFFAQEVASDATNDIALLKIIDNNKRLNLTTINFETQPPLLGETVIAVGNPYGLDSTISRGILSGIGRETTFQGNVIFSDLLQTDTAINPGNSGGPLINLSGNMLGMNTAIQKDAQGIGFAIPIERIENMIAKWLIPERFECVSLGIIPQARKDKNGNLEIFISEVIKDSPAWHAKIAKNAKITSFNGNKITKLLDLSRMLWKLRHDDICTLTIENEQKYTLKVECFEDTDISSTIKRRLSFGIQDLTQELADALGYPFSGSVLINDISEDSNEKIKRGDVLVKLGNIPIYKKEDIIRAIRGKHYKDKVEAVLISIVEQNNRRYLLKKTAIISLN